MGPEEAKMTSVVSNGKADETCSLESSLFTKVK